MKWRHRPLGPGIGIRSSVEQQARDLDVAPNGSVVQRRHLPAIPDVDLLPVMQQSLHQREVSRLRR